MKQKTDVGAALLLAMVLVCAGPAAIQAQSNGEPQTTNDGENQAVGATPGGAFLRSLIVPGWGHAFTESYTRGGFYFLTSGATLWMAYKTSRNLDASEERLALVEREVEAEILRSFLDEPEDLQDQVDADPRVENAQSLVDSRSQQMEDWTAFGIFWLLLGAADAFVSTHLADFPQPVEIDLAPRLEPRGASPIGGELRFTLPLD